MKKSYHHGDLREAIITETLAMIRSDEYHLIGFRELARRLDVSRTAPYRHFESVEDLLTLVAEEGYLKFIEYLEAVAKNPSLAKGERFIQLGEAYVNFALENPAHYRLLFDQRFFADEKFKGIQALASRAFSLLKQTSSQCLAEDASSADKMLIANLAWACVHGLSTLLMNGQMRAVKNRKEFIRTSCENFLKIVN